MTYVIIIDKCGKAKELNVKDFQEDELYKKAGFKTKDGFLKYHSWESIPINHKEYAKVSLYGKVKGNAGKENKYELPPPLDNVLFFGSLVLSAYDENGVVESFRLSEWESIYEQLMGGFETVSEGDETSEEDEKVDPKTLDKYGYVKDGFIADDDEEDEEAALEYESELSEEDYFE